MSLPKPLICGLHSTTLTEKDKDFLRIINPLGVILFKKNLINKQQVQELCSELRFLLERQDLPILIDQEGGSIYRLTTPPWRPIVAPLALAKFAYSQIDCALEKTLKLVELNAKLIAFEMKEIGINVNCTPVADLLIQGAHHITSTRSFGPNPLIVSQLVNSMAAGLKAAGVQAIMKHIPGQGRATEDSHIKLPVVTEDISVLENSDFKVFQDAKNINWAMLAHLKYTSLDPDNIATYSRKVVNYIKEKIGFDGILISDCITMKALTEPWAERAAKVIEAGIDLVLFGGCKYDIITEISRNINTLSEDDFKKIQQSFFNINNNTKSNYHETFAEYEQLLKTMEQEFLSLSYANFTEELKLIVNTLEMRNHKNADYSSPVYAA